MTVARLSEYQVIIDNVIFEYILEECHWISTTPLKKNELDKYSSALHLFLYNETPESQEFYEGYFEYISELKQILNSLDICSEL
jgi:hypothetical protein